MWNVFDRPVTMRTTNKCENWNSSWKKEVGASNPNFWNTIKKLVKKERESNLELLRLEQGESSPLQKKVYVQFNEKILRLKNLYLGGIISLNSYWQSMSEICYKIK